MGEKKEGSVKQRPTAHSKKQSEDSGPTKALDYDNRAAGEISKLIAGLVSKRGLEGILIAFIAILLPAILGTIFGVMAYRDDAIPKWMLLTTWLPVSAAMFIHAITEIVHEYVIHKGQFHLRGNLAFFGDFANGAIAVAEGMMAIYCMALFTFFILYASGYVYIHPVYLYIGYMMLGILWLWHMIRKYSKSRPVWHGKSA